VEWQQQFSGLWTAPPDEIYLFNDVGSCGFNVAGVQRRQAGRPYRKLESLYPEM
jgi:hypothetical protein